jgi:hypothetical protein
MTISEKQNILKRIASGCERAIIGPENPYTMDNPDMIAANGNRLFAIYIPSYKEWENGDHLLRRVYMSQFGYGQKMMSVLLLSEVRKQIGMIMNSPAFFSMFDLISFEEKEAIKFVALEKPNKKRDKHFSEMQEMQYIAYRQRLHLSEKSKREFKSFFSAEDVLLGDLVSAKSWSTRGFRESRYYRHTQLGSMAVVSKRENSSFKTTFDQLMTTTFLSMYQLDNGVVYPTAMSNELSLLNTDWQMFDDEQLPNDYNRMLSFVGLAPVSISTNREAEILNDMYQNIRKNGIE